MKVLLCWVGFADIRAAQGQEKGLGPIGQVLEGGGYDGAYLLMDSNTARDREFVERFLQGVASGPIELEFHETSLENPTDFRAIYQIANAAVEELANRAPVPSVTIHLSPGTPAMQAVWILISARTGHALVQSSPQQGVQSVELPFDIHAEFLPDVFRAQGRRVEEASLGSHVSAPGFENIKFRSPEMRKVVERASKVALIDVPVLLHGETGTGKELFARAIHKASPRSAGPLVVVNCGAIPESLIESMLFGYVKGAFTGASANRPGYFEEAGGGTIFLDEVGELPLSAQSRLLRVLQERKVQRVGGVEEIPVDVRIISATHRDLRLEVAGRSFREDLYYRLAVVTVTLPPLRIRRGDLPLLTDELLAVTQDSLGLAGKKLSPGARSEIAAHRWPGNVRELQAALVRALVFSEGAAISAEDMRGAIERVPDQSSGDVLERPLGDGFSLDELLGDIKDQYVRRALEEAGRNQSRAAELLGYRQQTLWAYMKRRGIA
jgi:transcriptional regulator with PAS, ATPase and Fis domain